MKDGQHIARTINTNLRNGTYEPVLKQPVEISERAADIINELFDELLLIFPGTAATLKGNEEDLDALKTKWSEALIRHGVNTQAHLKAGIRRAEKEPSDFFPGIGKFIEWCQPVLSDYGLPEPEAAYYEAARGAHGLDGFRWSHAAVYAAARETGIQSLKTQPERITKKRFLGKYQVICTDVMAGRTFDRKIMDALEHKEDEAEGKPLTPEIGNAWIEKLRGRIPRQEIGQLEPVEKEPVKKVVLERCANVFLNGEQCENEARPSEFNKHNDGHLCTDCLCKKLLDEKAEA